MLKRTSIIIGLIILGLIFTPSYSVAKTYKIGILPFYSSDRIWSYYKPFIEYLNKESGLSWELKIYPDYYTIIDALCRDEISVAYFGPVSFGLAHERCGVKPLIVALGEDGKPFYKAIIFTLNKKIKSIKDLKYKRFAFGSKHSSTAYVVPRKILEDEGIKMEDIKPIFLKDHEKVIEAVINNDADAGAVKESVIKKYKDFKLKVIKESGPLPHHTFCSSKNLDPKIEKAFQKALLKLKPTIKETDKEITKKWDPELQYGFILPPEGYMEEVKKLLGLHRRYN